MILAAHELGNAQSDTFNATSGLIGWGDQPRPVSVLMDTGSETSFISSRALRTLQSDVKPQAMKTITVMLTNGETTTSNQGVTVGLTLQGSRTRTTLRVLEWDAYDVILGLDWMTQHRVHWDFRYNRITQGMGRARQLSLEETGIHLLSFRKAHEAVRDFQRRSESTQSTKKKVLFDDTKAKTPIDQRTPTLYVVKLSEESQQARSNLLLTTPKRFHPVLRKFQDVLLEELPIQYPRKRDVKHDIDTGNAKPVNLLYYPL
ncbi:hypothetical protein LTR93_012263 [Exophiala xenobiotica]|nr:hypothetical protein LTR93_012263 [Exophiala xenobiotica]